MTYTTKDTKRATVKEHLVLSCHLSSCRFAAFVVNQQRLLNIKKNPCWYFPLGSGKMLMISMQQDIPAQSVAARTGLATVRMSKYYIGGGRP